VSSEAPRDDADARRRIAEHLDVTMVVEASAGTGKTTALVERMLAIIGEGRARLERMVAVTFTEKAAGEMKLRLRTELERRRASETDATRRGRFETALSELETTRIGTIHGFCADLLRERPLEAGIDPGFEVVAEEQERELIERAFDRFLPRVLEDPPEGVRRLLRRPARGGAFGGGGGPVDALRDAVAILVQQRDFEAPWERPQLQREAEIDAMVERIRTLGGWAAHARRKRDPLARDLQVLADFVDELDRGEAAFGREHDRLEHQLLSLSRQSIWKRSGRGELFGEGLARETVVAERQRLHDDLLELTARLQGDLAALLREELRPVVADYRTLKEDAGLLDFLDLLLCTRDLLRDDPSVRAELHARFSRIFVDEFQDTDPLQAEIVMALARDPDSGQVPPGKLFVVGDPKQSIYSFRRADVTLYTRVTRELVEAGAERVELTKSFRANAALQSVVNASFAPLMRGSDDGTQADYSPLQRVRPTPQEQPAVIALPVPRPYSAWGNLARSAIDPSTADAVGALVDYLIHDSGMSVWEGEREVPLSARHVCLLFRRMRSWDGETTRDYVRALEARRIPHVLVGGRSFHAREEVLALRNALSAVEWPDDELAVFATLRGPLMSLPDDALLDFRHHVGRLSPLRAYDEQALSEAQREVTQALSVLGELHRRRNGRPIAETVGDLLARTRAHAGIAIWPTGEQALANVLRVADDARRFEARGATSFRAFVVRLERAAERGETEEAPVIEEGTEGVRIMSVHRAKGLEFPVVILCDPSSPRVRASASRQVDPERGLMATRLAGCAPLELSSRADPLIAREEAEEVRIAYVAATRARDLLVVPCVGDAMRPGWVDVPHPALYPEHRARRSARSAPGCPPFGGDSVLDAGPRAQRRPDDSVMPGEHTPRTGDHRVVWWDPALLKLDRVPLGGLRQHELLTAADDPEAERAGQESYARWREFHDGAVARGRQATLRGRTVTQLAGEMAEQGADSGSVADSDTVTGSDSDSDTVTDSDSVTGSGSVRFETARGEAGARPSGARFGNLVHAVLADALAAGDGAPQLEGLARMHGRMLSSTEEEIAAAARAAADALAHPLLQRARASAELRVETALAFERLGEVIEGVVDLAFREPGAGGDGRWTVVDFKTDADPAADPRYALQLALYAAAMTRATGEPVEPVLLAV
jgi:ATP-dependent exoDNAse (exonuclease V) beta subunit